MRHIKTRVTFLLICPENGASLSTSASDHLLAFPGLCDHMETSLKVSVTALPFLFLLCSSCLRRGIENLVPSSYCGSHHSRGNARSKYKQWNTDACKVSLVGKRMFNNVEHDGQTDTALTTLLFTLRTKDCWTMLKTLFDGYQTSFKTVIQHHAT